MKTIMQQADQLHLYQPAKPAPATSRPSTLLSFLRLPPPPPSPPLPSAAAAGGRFFLPVLGRRVAEVDPPTCLPAKGFIFFLFLPMLLCDWRLRAASARLPVGQAATAAVQAAGGNSASPYPGADATFQRFHSDHLYLYLEAADRKNVRFGLLGMGLLPNAVGRPIAGAESYRTGPETLSLQF